MNKIARINNLLNEALKYDNQRQYEKANEITKLLVKLAQGKNENEEDISTGEPEPENIVIFSDIEGNEKLRLSDGKEVNIPKDLKYREKFAEKDFLLSYDPIKEQFLYVSADKKTAFPLNELNKVKEIRGKKVDFWKQIGLRGLFGDLRIPNLNKIVALEPFVRKSVIDLSNKVRPFGDAIKGDVRKITDQLTEVFQESGGNVAGGKSPEFSDAEKKLGPSEDRSSSPSITPSTVVNVPGSETLTGTPSDSTTAGEPKPDGGETDPIIKSNGATLKDIHTAKDLLFWSMMVANKIPFNSWSKDKESEYYSQSNYNTTLGMINKLTSSNWVKRINPEIASLKQGAISELDSRTTKTANKTMNRQILASMNEICEELDRMDLVEASNKITKIMVKLAQEMPLVDESESLVDSPQITAWVNYGRSLAKKDPDFIPPIKPKVSMITYTDITEKAIADYHLYKNNKKQLPKLTSMEENQLKTLAQNADRAR